ncbi:MAG: SDR family oxidoreductase [Anaerolineales bacterium]|nr:SDR family oxidoreductase [Anaerolineales bacterium]
MSTLPSFDLSGRAAVVTGGAGLLGRQFCATLAAAGAAVLVADANLAAAGETAAGIQAAGGRAAAAQVDVGDAASVAAMAAAAVEQCGGLDILVNSAALDPKFDQSGQGKHSSAFEEYSLEAWEASLRVNLTGAFLCSQAAAKQMLTQQRGVIINICSTYGLGGPDQRLYQRPGQPTQYKPVDYTVTKAGILGLTKYLATYYGDKGIRANALTPGGVFNGHDEQFVQAYSARAVLGRMAQPDEMNGALLFLASDASSYMTGANLVVDGGWTAW